MADRTHLTDQSVEALEPRATRYVVKDSKTQGLEIRVSPSGMKVWALVYRLGPRVSRLTLGTWGKNRHEVGAKEARRLASEAWAKIRGGVDPTQPDPRTLTVKEAVESYLSTRPKQRPEFERDVLPVIGDRPVASLSRADVTRCLDHLRTRAATNPRAKRGGEYAAEALRKYFGVFFRHCYERGWIDSNPAREIRAYVGQPRERILAPNEITAFWWGLERTRASSSSRAALRFALVTGQRIGVILALRWEEVRGDLKDRPVWHQPAAKTKAKRDHEVPLPSLACELLVKQRALYPESPWCFPSVGEAPVSYTGLAQVMRSHSPAWKINPPVTVHDLRRSCATGLADLGISYRVVADVLGHRRPGPTAVYVQQSGVELKRQALETWSDYLRTLINQKESNPAE